MLDVPGGAVPEASENPSFEADAGATVALAFEGRRSRLLLSYAPTFTLTDFTGNRSRQLLNTVTLGLGYRGRRYVLALTEAVSYGQRRFTGLTPPEVNPVTGMVVTQVVPGPATVLYANSVTQATANFRLTRRQELMLVVGYNIGGGINEESRLTLPLVSGPRAETRWTYRLTLRDNLGTSLTALRVHTHDKPINAAEPVNTGSVALTEHWTHVWEKSTTTDLSAGVALLVEGEPRKRTKPYGQGFATFTRTFPTAHRHAVIQLLAGAGVAILVDQVSGQAQPVAQANLQGAWSQNPVRLYLNVGAIKSLESSQANAAEVATAELGARYSLSKRLDLALGVRANDQSIFAPKGPAAAGAANGFSYAAFVGLVWHPDALVL